jgi:hypothetical protein
MKNGLPMTISDEDVYDILRKDISGGLCIVGHRFNVAGENYINKLSYEDWQVISKYTQNIITHNLGMDWSSLYPSSCCGNKLDENPFTGSRLYMPGKLTKKYNKKT